MATKKRKPSDWNKEVKKYTDKGMDFPKALQAAKKTYKPKK